MKIFLLLLVSAILILPASSQSVTPRVGQTETAIAKAYQSTPAKKMAAAPAGAKTSARQVAYQSTKYTDVFWIPSGKTTVESQHIVFNDTLTRHNFVVKLDKAYSRYGSSAKGGPTDQFRWVIPQAGGKQIIAELLIVYFRGQYKEAIVYRPY